MIVPTYTNTAKNVTGVAGQQFGFKMPAGTLSAPMVAEGNAWQDASTKSAQLGGYFLQQYHSTTVNGAFNAAVPQLDRLSMESSKLDPTHKLADKTPAGHYAKESAKILKTAEGHSMWPTTSTAITSKVGGYMVQQTRAIKKQSNLRLLSKAKGELKTTIATHTNTMGMALPAGWDGDVYKLERLAPAAWIAYNNAITASRQGAEGNVQTFAEHEQVKRDVISDASVYAVGQRIRAAGAWQASEDLLAEVSDPKNWQKLIKEDRLALQKSLDAQITRQIRQEDTKERRAATDARRVVKTRQTKNYRTAMTAITEWQLGKGEKVTYDQIAKMDLTPAAQSALQSMLEVESPRQSQPSYVGKLNLDLVKIATSNLDPAEIDSEIGELMETANEEFAKKRQSALNVSDYKTFFSRAMTMQKDKGLAAAVKELHGRIDDVWRERSKTNGKLGMLPEDFIRVHNAREAAMHRLFQGGANARAEAFERAIFIISDTAGMSINGTYLGPQYPTFLPLAENIGISTPKVVDWSKEDWATARLYITDPESKLTRAQRDQSIEELKKIKLYRDNTQWLMPAPTVENN